MTKIIRNTNGDKSFLEIDRLNIDDEWMAQPKLLHKWADKLAKAKLALEYLVTDLEIYEAEVKLDAKNNFKEHGFARAPSDKTVDAYVMTKKKYRRLRKEISDARYKLSTCQVMVSAIDTKKKALENAVELLGMDMFAEPRAKKNGRDAAHKLEQRRARRSRNRDEND